MSSTNQGHPTFFYEKWSTLGRWRSTFSRRSAWNLNSRNGGTVLSHTKRLEQPYKHEVERHVFFYILWLVFTRHIRIERNMCVLRKNANGYEMSRIKLAADWWIISCWLVLKASPMATHWRTGLSERGALSTLNKHAETFACHPTPGNLAGPREDNHPFARGKKRRAYVRKKNAPLTTDGVEKNGPISLKQFISQLLEW